MAKIVLKQAQSGCCCSNFHLWWLLSLMVFGRKFWLVLERWLNLVRYLPLYFHYDSNKLHNSNVENRFSSFLLHILFVFLSATLVHVDNSTYLWCSYNVSLLHVYTIYFLFQFLLFCFNTILVTKKSLENHKSSFFIS